jgi:hypothetical protein
MTQIVCVKHISFYVIDIVIDISSRTMANDNNDIVITVAIIIVEDGSSSSSSASPH